VSHEKLKLVPQGVLPRDLGMKVRLQRKVPATAETAEADVEPLLIVDTKAPVIAGYYSYFVVYTHDTRTTDLDVTLTSPDVSRIAWATGSPLAPSADMVIVVTIPAGRSDVAVPCYASTPDTDVVVTAEASGYPAASVIFDIEVSPIYPVRDVIFGLTGEGWVGQANDINGQGVSSWSQNRSAAYGTPTIALPSLVDDNTINLTLTGAHAGTSFGGSLLHIMCGVEVEPGVVLPESSIGWEIALSGFGSFTPFVEIDTKYGSGFISYTTTGYAVQFRVFGKIYGTAVSGYTCGIPAGATITVTAKLDGVLIDNIRSTFTITVTT
jgi:hypothetical protein